MTFWKRLASFRLDPPWEPRARPDLGADTALEVKRILARNVLRASGKDVVAVLGGVK